MNDQAVQTVGFKGSSKKFQVKSFGQLALPEGLLSRTGIKDEKQLLKFVKDSLDQSTPKKISNKNCVVSLPCCSCFENVYFLPPDTKDGDLENILKVKMSEHIPSSFNELVYDYSVTKTKDNKVVYAVAAKRSVIQMYHNFFKKVCKLKPIIAEPESLSILRNIKGAIDSSKPVIVATPKGDKIEWIIYWLNGVFDSNLLPMESFITDIKSSVNNFENSHGVKISSLLFMDVVDGTDLSLRIKQELGFDAMVIEKHFEVDKKSFNGDVSGILAATGAALKGVGKSHNTQINLFKRL